MKKTTDERRRFIRLEIPIIVRYIVEDDPDQSRKQVATKDLSCDGLRFISEKHIADGSVLDLNLTVPGANNPVHIRGKTVWSKKMSTEDMSPVEIGVEFMRIEEDNKHTFLKYLCDIMYNEAKIVGKLEKRRGA